MSTAESSLRSGPTQPKRRAWQWSRAWEGVRGDGGERGFATLGTEPAPSGDQHDRRQQRKSDQRRDFVVLRGREEFTGQPLREVEAGVYEDSDQNAAAGVVEHPGDQ